MIWGGDYVAAASFKPGNTVYWTEMCSVPFQNFDIEKPKLVVSCFILTMQDFF